MFLIPRFLIVLFVAFISLPANAVTTEPELSPEIVSAAGVIQKEKSRLKRLELLGVMIDDVKNRVKRLPDSIEESEIPRVQTLYELEILFATMQPEKITPASCPELQRTVRDWANPSGAPEPEISAAGRLVIDVVKSVCAP